MNDIETLLRERRGKTFASSAQLTLGQIIEKLEGCKLTSGENAIPKEVVYDFGTAIPTTLDSWRGLYSELALGYRLSGYDDQRPVEENAQPLLHELKSAIGVIFGGWKGGRFTMTEDTPVWVANRGDSGNTGIVDVVDDDLRIVIMTAYCEL